MKCHILSGSGFASTDPDIGSFDYGKTQCGYDDGFRLCLMEEL